MFFVSSLVMQTISTCHRIDKWSWLRAKSIYVSFDFLYYNYKIIDDETKDKFHAHEAPNAMVDGSSKYPNLINIDQHNLSRLKYYYFHLRCIFTRGIEGSCCRILVFIKFWYLVENHALSWLNGMTGQINFNIIMNLNRLNY